MILNSLWYVLIGIVFTVYIVLDGYDLGVGILNRFLGKTDEERKRLYYSVGPFWDGNEVWLLTGGGALFAAFPVVYASVFSGFYTALILLLFFLILRIISLEFRNKLEHEKNRLFFDNIFMISSLLIVFILGVALGNIARGLELVGGKHYYGGFLGLLNPYSIFMGLFAVSVIIMHGSAYVMLKLENEVYKRAMIINKYFIFINVAMYLLNLLLTIIFVHERLSNYLENPILFVLLILPLVFLFLSYLANKSAKITSNFLMSSLFITSLMIIFGVGNYPYFLPSLDSSGGLDIYNSASTPATLRNMLIIVLLGLPIVVFYTVYIHRIFSGKIKEGENLY
ncbi:MAG: cytochrome d ubiquinol oxidase subunit II [Deltaproteobacteria bacterium]|nr:cytochrome d ubiquinol oxidase subunit II [Deltaproteobacteria bacterium]